MFKTVTVKYYLNKDKTRKNGLIPICARIILDREKFEISTRQYVKDETEWDQATQRIRKKSPINGVLSEIEHQVSEAYNYLKYHNRPLTALALRNQLKGEKTDKLRLLDFVDDYYLHNVKENGTYAIATKKTYKSTIGHLKAFLEYSGKSRLMLSEVDSELIKDFDAYLVNRGINEKKGLRKNSANKYHINLKTIFFKAVDKKLIERNPYKEFKFKSEPGRLTYLTETELNKLEKHKLGGNKSLHRVRDIFMFSVYTGLRHSDATNLKECNIEIDGREYWITYTQQKTKDPNRIPMLNKAVDIYKKHEQERKITGYILPRLSHQKLNAYLKVIAELVGIEKPLTHHVARHTAATTIFLQNGVSLEVTAKQLGHRSLKSTQIYAKVSNIMLRETAGKLNKIL